MLTLTCLCFAGGVSVCADIIDARVPSQFEVNIYVADVVVDLYLIR